MSLASLFLVVTLLCAFASTEDAPPVEIVSFKDEVNPDGSFAYGFEASNGIKMEATGNVEQQSGSVKYTDPDGNPVEWTYTADQFGYHPQGSVIPALPSHIARALEYIKDHSTEAPAVGADHQA